MIKEEYAFSHLESFLNDNIDLLIAGVPGEEERSKFFFDLWESKNKDILLLKLINPDSVSISYYSSNGNKKDDYYDLCVGLPRLLNQVHISEKNILLDISSLDNVLIMFLTKQLLINTPPKTLFSSYIRPEKYISESGNIGYELCQQIGAIEAVPGFARREADKQSLCAFLGFEGVRLKGILETVQCFDKLVPIVAFPSGSPQWYNVTMWNIMDVLQSEGKNTSVYKCYSESIFDAVELLNKSFDQDEAVILAPLGTRPHSMACAIFACQHKNTRILYDFVIENKKRAIGISEIKVYHLTPFIND